MKHGIRDRGQGNQQFLNKETSILRYKNHTNKNVNFEILTSHNQSEYNKVQTGHFIPSGPPMDGKFSYCDKNLVCYVYKCKKLLFKSTFG